MVLHILISFLILHQFVTMVNSDSSCKGKYDSSKYATLDRVCYDCNHFFRPPLYEECKEGCFTNDFFHACLTALKMTEGEIERFKDYIKELHGAPVDDRENPKTGAIKQKIKKTEK